MAYTENLKASVNEAGILHSVAGVAPTHELDLEIQSSRLNAFTLSDGQSLLVSAMQMKPPKYVFQAHEKEHCLWCLLTREGHEHEDLNVISLAKVMKGAAGQQVRLDLVHEWDGIQALNKGLYSNFAGLAVIRVREICALEEAA